MVQGDYADFSAVAKLIQSDAALAGEVLRLANSALFATRFEVVSILHAISVLGLTRLKSIVLTVGLRDFVAMGNRRHSLRRCWRHNLAAALTAEALAGACDIDRAEAYTSGLMHGIGHVALIALNADAYECAAHRASAEPERLLEFERAEFGFDHVDSASHLVRHWKLPFTFEEICRCDHHCGAIDPSHMAGAAELACDLASMLGFELLPHHSEWNPESLIGRLPQRFRKPVASQIPVLTDEIALKINMFEHEFLR